MAKRFEDITEREIKQIAAEVRKSLRVLIPKDYGYTIYTGRLEESFTLKSLLEKGYYPPMLIKDKDGEVSMLGYDENDTEKLTKLDKEAFKYLNFPKLPDVKIKKYPLSVLEGSNLAKNIYANINKYKAHFKDFHLSRFSNEILEKEGGEKAAVDTMLSFINSDEKIQGFVREFLKVTLNFSPKDVEYLGTAKETLNGGAFMELMRKLEDNGFSGTRGENLNFWSGGDAFNKATNTSGEISSSKVPNMALMFDVIELIKDMKDTLDISIPEEVTQGISRWYAMRANGTVNVYISSNKPSEGPALTMGNNFWIAELVTLQEKLKNGEIDSIMINLYDHRTGEKLGPYDFNSKEAEPFLEIVRRRAYQPSEQQIDQAIKTMSPEFQKKFKEMIETDDKAKPFSRDKNAPERPSTNVEELRNIALTFQAKAAHKALKKIPKTDTESPSIRHRERLEKAITKHVLHSWQSTKHKNKEKDKEVSRTPDNSSM